MLYWFFESCIHWACSYFVHNTMLPGVITTRCKRLLPCYAFHFVYDSCWCYVALIKIQSDVSARMVFDFWHAIHTSLQLQQNKVHSKTALVYVFSLVPTSWFALMLLQWLVNQIILGSIKLNYFGLTLNWLVHKHTHKHTQTHAYFMYNRRNQ